MQARSDRDLRPHRLRQPGHRGAQALRRELRPAKRVPPRQPPTAGTRRSRSSRSASPSSPPTTHAVCAEDQEHGPTTRNAVRWYRELLAFVPERRRRAASQLPARRAAVRGRPLRPKRPPSTRSRPYSYPKNDKSADAGYGALLSDAQLLKKATPAEQPGPAAHQHRQRPALLPELPGRSAQRPGLVRRCRETLRTEGSAGSDRCPARRRSQAARGSGANAASPGPCSPTPPSTPTRSTSPRRLSARPSRSRPTRTRAAPIWSSGRRPAIYKQGEQGPRLGQVARSRGQLRARRLRRAPARRCAPRRNTTRRRR